MNELAMSDSDHTHYRLRPQVVAHPDQGGIVLRSGISATYIRGSDAGRLWFALEPALRRGFRPDGIVDQARSDQARRAIRELITTVVDARLVHIVEDESPIDTSTMDEAVVSYLSENSDRPAASIAHFAEVSIEISGRDLVLAQRTADYFRMSGLNVANVATDAGADSAVAIDIRREGLSEGTVRIGSSAGLVIVGPRVPRASRDTGLPHQRNPEDGSLLRRDIVARTAMAQALISVVNISISRFSPSFASSRPEFYVTDGALVSELHPYVPLSTDVGVARGRTAPPAEMELGAWLDQLSVLWDPYLGSVGEPHPGTLPQLPFGLAASVDSHGDTHLGGGITATEARWSSLVSAFSASIRCEGVLGLGRTPSNARSSAAARWLAMTLDTGDLLWRPMDLPSSELTPRFHRLWSTLAMRYGVEFDLAVRVETSDSVYAAEVTEITGTTLARRVSSSPLAAAEEALLVAVLGRQCSPGAHSDAVWVEPPYDRDLTEWVGALPGVLIRDVDVVDEELLQLFGAVIQVGTVV